MIKKLLILIAFTGFNIQAQDTIYVGEFGREVVPKAEAEFYRIVKKDSLKEDLYHEYHYHLDNTLKRITTYSNYFSKKKERLNYRSFYKSGKTRLEIFYKKDKFDGTLVSYWENGRLKRKDIYNKGKLKEGQCWDETGSPVPYYDLNIPPRFPEGDQALKKYVTSQMEKSKIPGSSWGSRIQVSFYIDKDGSVSDIELVSGADDLSSLMALKLVAEMPDWSPAMQDGEPVRVKRTLPILLPAHGK